MSAIILISAHLAEIAGFKVNAC